MRRWIAGIVLIVVATTVAMAIYFGHTKDRASEPRYEDALNVLQERYLSGTQEEARKALLDEVSLVSAEKYETSLQKNQAHLLWLTYCRLYRLDAFIGDDQSAHDDYVKAKTWFQRALELAGIPADEVKTQIGAFSVEQCADTAKRYDRQTIPKCYQVNKVVTSTRSEKSLDGLNQLSGQDLIDVNQTP